jgi:hypothetical protein
VPQGEVEALDSRFQSRLERDTPLILDFCRRYGDAVSGHASERALRESYDREKDYFKRLPKSKRMDFEGWVREHADLQSGLVANWYHPSHILQMYDPDSSQETRGNPNYSLQSNRQTRNECRRSQRICGCSLLDRL